MKKTIPFVLLLFSGLVNLLIAQSSNNTSILLAPEISEDTTKFLMYIDTIEKYMYMDGKIVEQLIDECEKILDKKAPLSNSAIFSYAIQKIYYEQNNNNLLACYQIIKEHEHLLNSESISVKTKANFNYIKGYTLMTLGDIATAQKIYYELLENGRTAKDTSMIFYALYSLGQIYTGEQDYDSAIKHFTSLGKLKKTHGGRASNYALSDYELSKTYIESGQNDKALQVIENNLVYLEQEKVERLKPDFLLLQGHIALDNNDLPTAKRIYQEVTPLVKANNDPYTTEAATTFYAALLEYEKEFPAALAIYDSLIIQLDSTQLDKQHETLGKAHKVAYNMGNHLKAYEYSKKQNEVNEKIKAKKKQQETAYLKIKFESEQKEKENQELALEVLKEHNQNRLLYSISGVFLLGMLTLFSAFYQKKKYSQTLKDEVKRQTQELKASNIELNKTNKELFQFSYICSHDLKEPIQTIGTFTNLIEKKIKKENSYQEYTEYFQFINKGVTRLSNLLEQMRIYFDINNSEKLTSARINIKELFQTVQADLPQLLKDKNPVIILNNQLDSEYIHCSKFGLEQVLKNLIENAIQFNESTPPTVNLYFEKQKDDYLISVEDNGIGMEEKYSEYIFEPFKTLEGRHIHDSAGLGLAISKKIVNTLGGSIQVTSNQGKGSVFNIRLKIDPFIQNEKLVESLKPQVQEPSSAAIY